MIINIINNVIKKKGPTCPKGALNDLFLLACLWRKIGTVNKIKDNTIAVITKGYAPWTVSSTSKRGLKRVIHPSEKLDSSVYMTHADSADGGLLGMTVEGIAGVTIGIADQDEETQNLLQGYGLYTHPYYDKDVLFFEY